MLPQSRIIFLFILLHPRASDQRHETRSGRRWPRQGAGRTPAPRRPKPRVLARRRSGHQWWIETLSPPEDAPEQAPHTARGTPEHLAVRGEFARVLLRFRTRGRGQAESPAFRAPLHIACMRCATRKGQRIWNLRRARAGQTTRPAELWLFDIPGTFARQTRGTHRPLSSSEASRTPRPSMDEAATRAAVPQPHGARRAARGVPNDEDRKQDALHRNQVATSRLLPAHRAARIVPRPQDTFGGKQ